MSSISPFRLQPTLVPRIWGRQDLSPWYTSTPDEPIGEAWLSGPQCVVMDGPFAGRTLADLCAAEPVAILGSHAAEKEFPVLLKLLFPDDWLSVQVHPNDEQAAQHKSRGKTECWYILDADKGATVALGFNDPDLTIEQIRDAIAENQLEPLLHYEPVSQGDMVFVDANTVHAIGPGVTILEIQQTSDITYRLYDYGRPRELHVDKGLSVLKMKTRAGKVSMVEQTECRQLIGEKYFCVERFDAQAGERIALHVMDKPQAITLLEGTAQIVGENFSPIELSMPQTAIVPANTADISIRASTNAVFIRSTP